MFTTPAQILRISLWQARTKPSLKAAVAIFLDQAFAILAARGGRPTPNWGGKVAEKTRKKVVNQGKPRSSPLWVL